MTTAPQTADHTTNPRRRSRRLTVAATSLIVALTFASACSSGESSGDPPSAPSTPAPTVVVPSTEVPPTSTPSAALQRQLTDILATHRANHEFAGAVLALREADGTTLTVTSGTKELSSDSGAVDPNVPWNIGSLTKTFVAVVVLQLADEGAIDLDAAIGPYFPDLPTLAPITPRQLLQHTSGLNEYWPSAPVLQDAGREWTPIEEIAVAEAAGRVHAPGGSFHYSNTNYIVLGELITRLTSEEWDDAVRERITEPLGMRSTGVVGFDAAPGFIAADRTLVPFDSASVHPSVGGAAGGMQSTASDLLVFIQALVDGRLLSDRIQAEMETFTPGEDYSQFGIVHGYGLGFERYTTDQVTAVGHMGTGAAHGAFAGVDPESGTAVVTLLNSDMGGTQAFMAFEALVAAKS